jgi:hypothetical protein
VRRIAEVIRANLTLRVFLPLFALALATTWYGLGPSLERIRELTGGQRFVDMQPTLTPALLIAQLRAYTPETVRFYFGWSAFDYAWPLITFTTLMFVAAWLARPLPARWQSWFVLLVGAGYATVLMDWLENAGYVAIILSDTPEPLGLAWFAVLAHRGKLVCNFLFNFMLLVLLLRAAGARLRKVAR